VKKRDDPNDVIREESSRNRERLINTAAINERAERRDAVPRFKSLPLPRRLAV